MSKISAYSYNTTPSLSDYQLGDSATGPTTEKTTNQALLSLLFSTDVIGAWQSYTPTVTLGGGATNGNAVITGSYCQIGKTVFYRVNYLVGTTTSFTGLSSMYCTLPVAAVTPWAVTNSAYGYGTGSANIGGVSWDIGTQVSTTTSVLLICRQVSATFSYYANITATQPSTWGTNSNWAIVGTYEAA